MRALSLTQPWATAMALQAKRIETRSWKPPISIFGVTIAIHAAKGFPRDAKDMFNAKSIREALPGVTVDNVPLGAIVALGRLVECRRTEDWIDEITTQEHIFGNYDENRYGWRFEDVRALSTPVPCKGALGLWLVPHGTEIAVLEQLGGVRG